MNNFFCKNKAYNCYYEKFSDGSVKNIQDEIPFDLPEGWGWARGKNCFQEMKTRKPNGEEFVYIDIDAIDNKKNTITNAKALKVKDAPSHACRYVECGSVLFSLVRPYLKNIAFVEEKYASSNCIKRLFCVHIYRSALSSLFFLLDDFPLCGKRN